ncbi:MAG: hypothetical protein D6674_04970 [Acidobacteria bacterium]|jgi:hypothetical protein|nr:MAG: hypothetical protein D6674_04970 [Acidobacteriota bacterium]
MRYLVAGIFLLIVNLIYSSYAIHVSKDYAKKLSQLKQEKDKHLKIKAQIEKSVNYTSVKSYVEKTGFNPIDWSQVRVIRAD